MISALADGVSTPAYALMQRLNWIEVSKRCGSGICSFTRLEEES